MKAEFKLERVFLYNNRRESDNPLWSGRYKRWLLNISSDSENPWQPCGLVACHVMTSPARWCSLRHSRPDNILLDYTDFAVECQCWFFFFLSLSSPNYDLIYVNNLANTHELTYLYVPKIFDRKHGQYARGVFDYICLNRYLEMSIVFRPYYNYYYYYYWIFV